MRLKELGNQWRVYLNPTDYQRLHEAAPHRGVELAIELGAECGLRVSETSKLKRGDWRKTTSEDVDAMFLRVWGKDTSGESEDGKYREPFLPPDVYLTIANWCVKDNDIQEGEPLFDVTKRTLQKWIKDAAHTVADETGDDDYRKISSHDLRAYFATDRLIRRRMSPEVVQEVGGWENMQTLEPYLHAKFDDVIAKEFKEAGVY